MWRGTLARRYFCGVVTWHRHKYRLGAWWCSWRSRVRFTLSQRNR